VNLNYWGCNQYITQRALGADLQTARTGILFAGFIKLMMPVIVMLPGIAAYVLYKNGHLPQLEGGSKDGAYSAILGFLPSGLKGLSIAALTAAIVASLAGKLNSISTIFTLDVYKKYFKTTASEENMVWVGRLTVLGAMVLAVIFTWEDLLGIGGEGGFTFIQKYTGFISPGVFAMFILGMFWKRTTSAAALTAALLTIPLSTLGKFEYPEVPFLDRMGYIFLWLCAVIVTVSLADPNSKNNPKGLKIEASMFQPGKSFVVGSVLICGVLAALYTIFW